MSSTRLLCGGRKKAGDPCHAICQARDRMSTSGSTASSVSSSLPFRDPPFPPFVMQQELVVAQLRLRHRWLGLPRSGCPLLYRGHHPRLVGCTVRLCRCVRTRSFFSAAVRVCQNRSYLATAACAGDYIEQRRLYSARCQRGLHYRDVDSLVLHAIWLLASAAGMNSIVVYAGSEILGGYFPFTAAQGPAFMSHAEYLVSNIVGVAWCVASL